MFDWLDKLVKRKKICERLDSTLKEYRKSYEIHKQYRAYSQMDFDMRVINILKKIKGV